ncbi:MAG: PD-(D/E)XK nuclease family protein [Bacteroidales bacterium]|jgi:CRISPR/Cas system-associated exonuclease Cas4 (RecB family)|nr:PD-(D/E)XK nuclease family protein [Bacteroidales bacterium]
MTPFLFLAAEHIKKTYSDDLPNLCVVVPGRRSIVFLRKYLAELYGKSFLSPAFFSVEDFFQHLTGIRQAKQEEQLLLLYQIHLELFTDKEKQNKISLYEFAGNAQIMLGDFNEIDANLVDTKVLFDSLFAIKELSFFGKQEEELTDFQKKYLLFFKELGIYYEQFTQRLLKKNKSAQGFIYRKAAENIAHYIDKQPYTKYLFIGFNALTKAEKTVTDYLKQTEKLDYLVDGDVFYTEDNIHEAGRFLRETKKELFDDAAIPFIGDYYREIPKKIHIIGLPQSVTQAKVLHELLSDLQEDKHSLDSTALVPVDESLLLPILHAIDTQQANITMGYPLNQTLLYRLVDSITLILDNKSKTNKKNAENKSEIKLYYKDLFAFFDNPYLVGLLKDTENRKETISEKITNNQKLFYSEKDYKKLTENIEIHLQELLFGLFYKEKKLVSICELIRHLLLEIYRHVSLKPNEQETLYLLYKQIDSLKTVLENNPIEDMSSFRFLFSAMISELTLSFKSDSTQGLQIMGLLETRTLDFKNVLMLSVNEGVLPKGKTENSFIPYDVKQHFGLPSYKGKDAVFSYHFYRLLQRAENIYLLYNLDAKRGDAEKSRFIHQLKSKLQHYNNVKITEKVMAYSPVSAQKRLPFVVAKDEETLSRLAKRKYSASSINTYLECGLQFYFRYVLGLEEDNTFSPNDMLQSNIIGTVVHYILEQSVENGRFKHLTKKEIEQAVWDYMCGEEINLTENDLLYEKNHLVYRIIVRYIELYLKHARSFEKTIFIEKTEEKLEQEFVFDEQKTVTLKGIIDRVDNESGQRRIVDYKTGSVTGKELKISGVGELFDGEHGKAFQLMFYAYLYYKQFGNANMEAEIVALRKITQQYILSIDGETCLTNTDLQTFEQLLADTVSSVFDVEQSFQQTENQKHCKYCTYKNLCGK